MKQLYLVIFSSFILNFCAAAQDYNVPVEYMQAISKQRENISKKFMAYVSASAHGKGKRKYRPCVPNCLMKCRKLK
jgi:hypothetical protein